MVVSGHKNREIGEMFTAQAYVQHSNYSQQYGIIIFQVAKRLDFNCSHHKIEMIIMCRLDRVLTIL